MDSKDKEAIDSVFYAYDQFAKRVYKIWENTWGLWALIAILVAAVVVFKECNAQSAIDEAQERKERERALAEWPARCHQWAETYKLPLEWRPDAQSCTGNYQGRVYMIDDEDQLMEKNCGQWQKVCQPPITTDEAAERRAYLP